MNRQAIKNSSSLEAWIYFKIQSSKYFIRRDFLAFLGSSAAIALLPSGCASFNRTSGLLPSSVEPLKPSLEDHLKALSGIHWKILVKQGDLLNKDGLRFGMNNDFVAILPGSTDADFILVGNHESVHPLLNYGNERLSRDKVWVDQEMNGVGLSVLRICAKDGNFELVVDDPINRRIDSNTLIPIISEHPIVGSKVARGTLANCSGGVTPWGTVLTCEENYGDFVGERLKGRRTIRQMSKTQLQWVVHYEMPPEHYGRVVEVVC